MFRTGWSQGAPRAPGTLELADRHFFETLVRIHRAGEGAPHHGEATAPAPHQH
ncbi:DUF6448 family protein [Desulfuromonas versatilis]|uniref:DUF6448 family protein n=1 Tax=Desulfuromonas versatilis TaxID=2802975 RepID=UPI001C85BE63|nr:DUF6448 family protein [Desulfuromonas versatilis]